MKKSFRIVIVIMMALFCVSMMVSGIVSLDLDHIQTCEEEECAICNMIHIAQLLTGLTLAMVLVTFVITPYHSILLQVHGKRESNANQSLVFSKVQMNA